MRKLISHLFQEIWPCWVFWFLHWRTKMSTASLSLTNPQTGIRQVERCPFWTFDTHAIVIMLVIIITIIIITIILMIMIIIVTSPPKAGNRRPGWQLPRPPPCLPDTKMSTIMIVDYNGGWSIEKLICVLPPWPVWGRQHVLQQALQAMSETNKDVKFAQTIS